MQITPLAIGHPLLRLALDATSLRQQAAAANIANSTNPGYRALGVRFNAQMAREMAAPGAQLTGAAWARLQPSLQASPAPGAIAVDQEMAALTRNSIHYQALLKAINSQFELAGMALSDGRR